MKSKATEGILALSSGVICGAGIFFLSVLRDARKNSDASCRYLLILGAEVKGADTPGRNLMNRIERAESYLKSHPEVTAIPCGGCFREGQKLSEAEIIKNHLVQKGISGDRIIKEDKSTTTIENFRFAKDIITGLSGKDIKSTDTAVLTSDYHLKRAGIIARIQGYGKIGKIGAHTGKGFMKGALREVMCLPQLIDNFR